MDATGDTAVEVNSSLRQGGEFPGLHAVSSSDCSPEPGTAGTVHAPGVDPNPEGSAWNGQAAVTSRV